MKIFIISSSSFYGKIAPIKDYLEKKGHEVLLPNSYDNPNLEKEIWDKGHDAHVELERELFEMSEKKVESVDAVLCMNFEKHNIKNYVGGATFIELYIAFRNKKKIFLYHDVPEGMLYDEINGFGAIVINEDLDLIK